MAEQIVLPDGSQGALIHYLLIGGGKQQIACMPGLSDREFGASNFRPTPHQRSEVPDITTCPLCKETAEWRAAALKAGLPMPAPKPVFIPKPKAAPVAAAAPVMPPVGDK